MSVWRIEAMTFENLTDESRSRERKAASVRLLAMILGVMVVAALDLILLIGTSAEPPLWFGLLVLVMDLCLVTSSVAFGIAFSRSGRRLLGAMFLGNLFIMLAALMIRTWGVSIPRAALFGADLYWLNLYMVGLVVLSQKKESMDDPA